MSGRSSARSVTYDLRPAKQTERRIMLDLVSYAESCGLNTSDYRYVGMGANRFYDYLLLHRYLGLRKMVSLEHDEEMHRRAELNVPYDFIDVVNVSTTEFMAEDIYEGNTIYWFDYDDAVNQDILQDVLALATHVNPGDFVFVTVPGVHPRAIRKLSSTQRADWFAETFGDLAGGISMADCEDNSFFRSVHKLLCTSIVNAFAPVDVVFSPLCQIVYNDGIRMVTVGGPCFTENDSDRIVERCRRELPFLETQDGRPYRIPNLSLTDRERFIFDRASTGRKNSKEANVLRSIGFTDDQIQQYRELLRYVPRYVETIV